MYSACINVALFEQSFLLLMAPTNVVHSANDESTKIALCMLKLSEIMTCVLRNLLVMQKLEL
jgi:hypothetical protein